MENFSKPREKLLSSEKGAMRKKSFSLRVALGFPNGYEVGMANLGYQTIYRLLNEMEGVVCERFFAWLFDEKNEFSNGQSIKTLESDLNLRSFDIIAFSVPFELDYLNALKVLRKAGIPLKSSQRGKAEPLVMAGGVAITLNPEIMAPFFDGLVIGEAEGILPDFIKTYRRLRREKISKEEVLFDLSKIKGVYVPRFYDIIYDQEGQIQKREIKKGVFERIERRRVAVGKIETFSPISSPHIHFKDSLLVEVGRGCARGCYFCAAGYGYGPCRLHREDSILGQVERHIGNLRHVGLVGSLISDHPDLESICSNLYQRGLEIGVSSFRVERISPKLMEILVKSGMRTLTIAPEVGSEKMWKVINKNITRVDVLKSANIAAEADIDNLKLYFIIGLPFEEEQDINAVIDLIHRVHQIYIQKSHSREKRFDSTDGKACRKKKLRISINPFIPKPHTPFQWCAMNREKDLKLKMKRIEDGVRNLKGIRFERKSIRQAILQGILSVGNRRVGEGLFFQVQENLTFPQAWRKAGVDVDSIVFKEKDFGSSLPWDIIDCGINKSLLKKEFEKAKKIAEEFRSPICSGGEGSLSLGT